MTLRTLTRKRDHFTAREGHRLNVPPRAAILAADMFRNRSPFLRVWIALISLAVMAMPVSGAHLHLCFDGMEPPATFHAVEDGSSHDFPAATGAHNDKDVSLQSVALAKKHDGARDLPAALSLAAIIIRMPVTAPAPAFDTDVATPQPLRVSRILPPLRAPPV
jgi:hypothetical protein